MKKLLVQAGLMVGSLLICGGAANAQIQYRAEIPFDFQAAGRAYTAGKYQVGPIAPSSSVVAIRDKRSTKTRLLGHSMGGSDKWNDNGKLIFLKADGLYTLSEIVTPSFSMKLKKTKTDVRMAGGPAAKMETVAIALH
jgi:hypothetical protein